MRAPPAVCSHRMAATDASPVKSKDGISISVTAAGRTHASLLKFPFVLPVDLHHV